MTDKRELRELLAKVKAATKNDDKLFTAVAFKLGTIHPGDIDPWKDHWFILLAAGAFTDAALALTEKLLPGWNIQMFLNHNDDGGWKARVRSPRCDLYCSKLVNGEEFPLPTLPLAIIAATLEAKIAQETDNG